MPSHQQAGDELGGDLLVGWAKKDWGRWSGSCWEGVLAMGVAWERFYNKYDGKIMLISSAFLLYHLK